ncbi:MAG: DUF4168 domain-containing protein [Symploca sp. SIO2G7]|nr:DUF4168 domain-containing protein [Symploca sp. SIO2G7]
MTNPFALLPSLYSKLTLAHAGCALRLSLTTAQHSALLAKRSEFLTVKLLAAIGWLVGLTVILAGCAPNKASDADTQSSPPLAVSSEEVENYAKVVLAIEPKREAATKEILRISKKNKIPQIVCTKPKTITTLRRNVRGIAVNYCQQAKDISESNGLTISKFNDISAAAQSDEQLKIRIQNELIRLQK